jgi:hypothetical protein
MKHYLQPVLDHLIAPKPLFNTSLLSLSRVINRRKMLGECMKFWKYGKEEDLHREIAAAYHGLN